MFTGVHVQQQPSSHPKPRRPEPRGAYMPLGLSPVSQHYITSLHYTPEKQKLPWTKRRADPGTNHLARHGELETSALF